MNLYKVKRTDDISYDNFDSMVVAAESEQIAREMYPSAEREWFVDEDYQLWKNEESDESDYYYYSGYESWVKFKDIGTLQVQLIGTTVEGTKQSIIITSFNAG